MNSRIFSRSIQVLIVGVLIAMILFRGENQWLVAVVILAWLAFHAARALYIRRRKIGAWFKAAIPKPEPYPDPAVEIKASPATPAEVAVVEEPEQPAAVILRHLNCRISDKLKSAFPDATWNWEEEHPDQLALKGGSGRIILHQAGEYTNAEVTVDQFARIDFKLMKVVGLGSLLNPSQEKDGGAEPVTTDVAAWFDLVGQQQLTAIITELNTRGHAKLHIAENGDVFVVEDDAPVKQDSLSNMPAKTYWQELVKLITDSGVKASVEGEQLRVTW